ncbi:MAG: acetylornithine transaminase [Actinomycetaceae bacterium]|nr:acetylornithine transaminase [Actinomycetaceae bacterium]
MSNQAWKDRYADSMLGIFGTPQLVLKSGSGVWVQDEDGNQYMDLLGGIAVNALGHAHPKVARAVAEQASKLIHVSNFFATPPAIELGEFIRKITALPGAKRSPSSKVFLANSGTEANEAALKIVKEWANRNSKPRILALEHGFHGRSLGALSITHKVAYRDPFAPLLPNIEWIETGNIAALEAAFSAGDVAGIFVEPVQGEAGVLPLSKQYLQKVRELCDQTGALMVVDEVQTGIGRTGDWMGHHFAGITPDVITLAKGLGGGMPIGATVTMTENATGVLKPGQHGTTFGGNPVAAAAALAVLGEIESGALLNHAKNLGESWRQDLKALDNPHILDVRGRGLLIGIELDGNFAQGVVTEALRAGFIVNAATPHTLRLAPPLIIEAQQAAAFTNVLPELIQKATRS